MRCLATDVGSGKGDRCGSRQCHLWSDLVVIESANDYKCWFDAPESLERFRRLREPATAGVWQEVITRFAECRAEVAGNPALPLHLLELLRQDDDEHRAMARSDESAMARRPSWRSRALER